MTPNVIAAGILLAVFYILLIVGVVEVLFFVAEIMFDKLTKGGQRSSARKPHELIWKFMRRYDNIWIPAVVVVCCALGWWF
jgi:hypothetical protein